MQFRAVMIAPLPHHYTATVHRSGPGRAELDATSRPTIHGGAPPEFGGLDGVWSPEHLLLASIGLCLETTFEAYAARDRLVVDSWDVRMDGTVDRTAAGLAFTAINATIRITANAEIIERVHTVVERARHCLISSSLRVPVDVAVIVTEAGAAQKTA